MAEQKVMQIFIKTPSAKILTLQCTAEDTIQSLKEQIKDLEGHAIAPDLQKLSYAGKSLEPSLKLADYNLQNNDSLHLAISAQETMEIQVKTLTGKSFGLTVFSLDTIKSVCPCC